MFEKKRNVDIDYFAYEKLERFGDVFFDESGALVLGVRSDFGHAIQCQREKWIR